MRGVLRSESNIYTCSVRASQGYYATTAGIMVGLVFIVLNQTSLAWFAWGGGGEEEGK